jgi:hypothetical protein
MGEAVATTELSALLAEFSHGQAGLDMFRSFLRAMPLPERIKWLADELLRSPITVDDARARVPGIDKFVALQGDVITTSQAYQLGRRTDEATYMIATSSCDLIPDRRQTTLLLPVRAYKRAEFTSEELTSRLASGTLFKQTREFYLPVLPGDDENVVFNGAQLDPLATCANEALVTAERRASLTLVGWRVFGTLVREILIREATEEVAIR